MPFSWGLFTAIKPLTKTPPHKQFLLLVSDWRWSIVKGGRASSPRAPHSKVGFSSRAWSISGKGRIKRKLPKIGRSQKGNSEIRVFINLPSGAGDVSQQFKALSTLTEDLGLAPNTHMGLAAIYISSIDYEILF